LPPQLEGETERFDVVMMVPNESILVSISADASAGYILSRAGQDEFASAGEAVADPTFTIDDPAYSDYTITGVPVGPAAAAPEPATWAPLELGFAGLGFMGRKAKSNVLLAA
jgi:hypothetical protein